MATLILDGHGRLSESLSFLGLNGDDPYEYGEACQ